MREVTVAWFDQDQMYTNQLQSYCRKNFKRRITIQAYASPEMFQEKGKWDLLVATWEFYSKLKEVQKNIPHILLVEGKVPEELEAENFVQKYQRADEMFRKLLQFERNTEENKIWISKRKVDCYGIVSEVGRVEQIMFATALAKRLGEHKRILYLNLMQFCGGMEHLIFNQEQEEDRGSISDLLYLVLKGAQTAQVTETFQKIVKGNGFFDYICPAENPEHLAEINGELCEKLLMQIAGMGIYDVIIFDFGYVMENFSEMIKACKKIFFLKERGMELGGEDAFGRYLDAIAGFEDEDREEIRGKRQTVILEKEWFATGMGEYPQEIWYAGNIQNIMREILKERE